MSEGVYRALLIGNSTFPEDPHNLFDLNGPLNDIGLLREALLDERAGLFEDADVLLLQDKTKREITQSIEWFFRSAGFQDTLLLYYSGHGKSDDSDNLFLCAHDTSTDLIISSGISDIEIDQMMRQSRGRRFVIILDCCHSGAFKSAGGVPTNLKGTGRFLLTSSRRGQPSRDAASDGEPSPFTRHLVKALRTGADGDGDGYVSVNEVYTQVHSALREETNQIPQRQFDEAIGDIPLARAAIGHAGASTQTSAVGQKPSLAVSPPVIELLDVGADEELPIEIIEVYNEGGGDLNWTARPVVDWIEVTQRDAFCELKLKPPGPGINRGSVHIHDVGGGGGRTVRVLVKVRQLSTRRSITVTPAELDYGVVFRKSSSPPRTLLIERDGAGIEALASSDAPWIDVEQDGNVVTVSVDTSKVGDFSGHVVVRSTAGDRVIPVRAVIEEGPVLAVKPAEIDFGRTTQGKLAEATISVSNGGTGELKWRQRKKGDFFTTRRETDRLIVNLDARPGNHLGSISISSNGGAIAVDVRAQVVARRKQSRRAETPTTSSKKKRATPAKAKTSTRKSPRSGTAKRMSAPKRTKAKQKAATSTSSTRSLHQLISELGPAPPRVAIDYALQILRALTPVSERRSSLTASMISTRSVRVDAEGRVILNPFSIPRVSGVSDRSVFLPEKKAGRILDTRSDIYSVGIILYELLTGSAPFAGPSRFAIPAELRATEPQPPSKRRAGVPVALDRVVLRALAKDPAKRYKNAEEMISALQQAIAAISPPTFQELITQHPRRQGTIDAPRIDTTSKLTARQRVAPRAVPFVPSNELKKGEKIVLSAAVSGFDAPGRFAVPPKAGRAATKAPSRVVVTNKRLLLAPTLDSLLGPVRVSIPWAAITGVRYVDQSHETGKWIFKERKELACVYVAFAKPASVDLSRFDLSKSASADLSWLDFSKRTPPDSGRSALEKDVEIITTDLQTAVQIRQEIAEQAGL